MMIVFNLWGALFVALGVAVIAGGASLHLPPALGFVIGLGGPIAADIGLRVHKKTSPWKGARVRDILSDLFDTSLGGMVMILPIWFWGVALLILCGLTAAGVV